MEGSEAEWELFWSAHQTFGSGINSWCAAGRRVTTPADDKSFVQQAKEGIAAAAAVTADKASQAYQ